MKLLDRIALERALSMVLSFVLTLIKIFVPSKTGTVDPIIKPDRKWKPRWRKEKKDE
jgi:hypothetical protein